LRKGALAVVRDCACVRPGERVLIISDRAVDGIVGSAIADAAATLCAEVVLAIMDPRSRPGDEPPPHVELAMMGSDVIICPTSTTLFYTKARIKACQRGARFISMTGATPRVLASGAITADFRREEAVVRKVADLLTKGREVDVTTRTATDLSLSIAGRKAVANTGICRKPGDAQGVPDIEAYVAPIEDSAQGTLVVDGSTSVTGLVRAPIRIEIKDGIARRIEGGGEARQLLKVLRKARNPNAFRIAELGIGLNPNARLRGSIIEDESVLGTAHIAIGDNHLFGGEIVAPTHIDLVIRAPRIVLDGRTLLTGRRVVGL